MVSAATSGMYSAGDLTGHHASDVVVTRPSRCYRVPGSLIVHAHGVEPTRQGLKQMLQRAIVPESR